MPNAKVTERVYAIGPEDLLDSAPAPWDSEAIRRHIDGKVVMVTGAAGSIGSELCRQIMALGPRALVGFDQAETPLFLLERELSPLPNGDQFHAEIGSCSRPGDVQRLMRHYRPQILYHAAAYKHVSMMERNLSAAVENNVLGTWNVAQAAAAHGVAHFVLVSTDKAVRPASVMGATKRAAEILLRALQGRGETKFVAIRFGNVLGSSGSVLPIFQQQIASGGPVTVTDAKMERYFTTAPEAARLLLHACFLGDGGEIFVLDMGKPVKIVDLAVRMIEQCGLNAGRDIEIVFTGPGRGEKLSEQLYLQSETPLSTSHSSIYRLVSQSEPDRQRVFSVLAALQCAADAHDESTALRLLQELVPDFAPAVN